MFDAAEWETPTGDDVSNKAYDKLRDEKIERMTPDEKTAWNKLCEFIAREVSGTAYDVMNSGNAGPSDFAEAYGIAIRSVKLEET